MNPTHISPTGETNEDLFRDWVLIIESAGKATGNALTVKETGPRTTDYVMRGPAAFFGQENNNHRIYEENEYLPHLAYLQEKITKKSLLGELDHPKEFETSLQRVSHIVEGLDYDKGTRSVNITIRLMNTPFGQIAKNLVDMGVPLNISSRAAGSVMENKSVKIKRIFTYDLVCDPGFERAQLSRVFESAGAGVELPKWEKDSLFERLTEVTEDLGISRDSGVQVYKVPTGDEGFMKAMSEGQPAKKTNEHKASMTYVTVEQMDGYTALIRKEIEKIKESVAQKDVTSLETDGTSVSEDIEQRIDRIEKYTAYLAENVDKTISYADYLAECLDRDIEYTKYLAEEVDKTISYGEYLAETLDNTISYGEYLAETVDKNISYSEYLAETVDKNISYSEYLAETLDSSISYGEYLAETVDSAISYGEYLAESIDSSIAYGEYIAETVDNSISYAEYLGETMDVSIAYGEYLAEKMESSIAYSEYLAEGLDEIETSGVAKNVSEKIQENNTGDVASRIDRLIEAAGKRNGSLSESPDHFFRFITEGKRQEFEALNETDKQKVRKALEDRAYFNEGDVARKWEKALVVEGADKKPMYIELMPEKIKPLYEALDQENKDAIDAQSKLRMLDTQYRINNFWSTRPQFSSENIGLIRLNEAEVAAESKDNKLGYSTEHQQKVAAELARRFGGKK